jgi:hypothetical protein
MLLSVMALVRRSLLAVAVGAIAIVAHGPPAAADNGDGLLHDFGPGWSTGQLCQALLTTATAPTVCFERAHETIQITSNDIPPGVDALSMLDLSSTTFAATGKPLSSSALDGVRAYAMGQEGDASAVTVLVATDHHIFSVLATGIETVAQLAPVAVDIARRQQAHDGGPPAASRPLDPADDRAARSLDRLLINPVAPGLVLVDTTTLRQTFDDMRPIARSQRVIDLLNGAPSRIRLYKAGQAFLAITLTQHPFGEFAAIQLEGYKTSASYSARFDVPGVSDAIGFRLKDSGAFGIAFRRGRILATVDLSVPNVTSGDVPTIENTLRSLAQKQAESLPAGSTSTYRFPSAGTATGVAVAVTSALCLAVATVGRVAARRRRSPRRTSDRAPVPPSVERGTSSVTIVDVEAEAHTLRRQGLLLLVTQILAVDVVIVGVLVVTDVIRLEAWLGWLLVALGLCLGVGVTSRRARSEQRVAVGQAPPRLGAWPSPFAAIAGIVAATALLSGLALAAMALADLFFGPSLSNLERAKFLGLSPTAVSVLTGIVGILLLIAGATLSRLARMWARTSATRVRQRDRRRPILYLRSFDDDRLPLPALLTARRPFLELFLARGSDPFEEAVAWELAPFGPIIAVGRPGRPTASLGAARDLLPAADWQAGVAQFIDDARAVVVIIGKTEGLAWEIEQTARNYLHRVVFVFPPVDGPDIAARWAFTRTIVESVGGRPPLLPIPPERILLARETASGWMFVVASQRDEAAYRSALDVAMAHDSEARSTDQPMQPRLESAAPGSS